MKKSKIKVIVLLVFLCLLFNHYYIIGLKQIYDDANLLSKSEEVKINQSLISASEKIDDVSYCIVQGRRLLYKPEVKMIIITTNKELTRDEIKKKVQSKLLRNLYCILIIKEEKGETPKVAHIINENMNYIPGAEDVYDDLEKDHLKDEINSILEQSGTFEACDRFAYDMKYGVINFHTSSIQY